MESTAVSSTTLASVAYDEASGLLELEFCSQAVYQYFGVPAEVHAGLLRSSSKGAYFNKEIRDRYEFARLAERRS